MFDQIDLIIISTLSAFLLVSLFFLIRLRSKLNTTMQLLVQNIIDTKALEEYNYTLARQIEETTFNDKDGFIKFLSESRESAFVFIEDVQQAIINLKFAMDSDDEDAISDAYNKIITFIPASQEEIKND